MGRRGRDGRRTRASAAQRLAGQLPSNGRSHRAHPRQCHFQSRYAAVLQRRRGKRVVIGLAVRLSVAETPAFERVKAQAAVVAAPILSVLRNNWRTVVLAGGAFVAINGGFYLITTQLVSYGGGPHSVLKLDPRIFFTANLIGSAVALLATPFGGWLSDRLGRRPVYMAGVALLLVLAFPIYALVDTKDPRLIVAAVCLYQVPSSAAYGALAAMFSELFGANVRYSGASLGYQDR